MFRSISKDPYCDSSLNMIESNIITLKVYERSKAAGRSIADIGLKGFGKTLLAIQRGYETLNSPDENTVLETNDLVVLLGSESEMSPIEDLFKN